MKAITITADNQEKLRQQFATIQDIEQLPLGYILVGDFGRDEEFSTLTPQRFGLLFTVVGSLNNGWVDCVRTGA